MNYVVRDVILPHEYVYVDCDYKKSAKTETVFRPLTGIFMHKQQKYDLAVSGGSDFHGTNKPGLSFGTGYGKLYIHEDILENLRTFI